MKSRHKNHLLSCFFLFLFLQVNYSIRAQVGNPILDASGLNDALKAFKETPDSTHAVLVLNYVNANLEKKYKSFEEMLVGLPEKNFIKDRLPDQATLNLITNKSNIHSSQFKSPNNRAVPHNTGFGMMSLDAAGTLIAERFKQEMEIAFISKFKDWLEDSSKASVALRDLLPLSRQVLLQNEPYQYTIFLETLKESLRKDVKNIPLNIGTYLSRDPFNIGARHPEHFTALLMYKTLVQLTRTKSPGLVLTKLSSDPLVDKGPTAAKPIIYLTSMLSQLLTSPTDPDKWLEASKISTHLNSIEKIKVFFGLMQLRHKKSLEIIALKYTKNDGTKVESNLYNFIIDNQNRIKVILDWLELVASNFDILKENFLEIQDELQNGRDFSGEKLVVLENTLLITFKGLFKFPFEEFDISINPDLEPAVENIMTQVISFSNLVVYVLEKNYGLALTSAIDMLSTFDFYPKGLELIKRYGNFAVTVAKAENKNDMLAALRTAALPVGSYRIKRNSYANFSLNAYAGLSVGYQKYTKDVTKFVEEKNTILGFTATIGLAYS